MSGFDNHTSYLKTKINFNNGKDEKVIRAVLLAMELFRIIVDPISNMVKTFVDNDDIALLVKAH